jgi:hypothetical protein
MRILASMTLRGPWQAALVIALTSPLPLLSLLGGGAMALVTLRQGAKAAVLVMLLAGCISGGLFWLLFGSMAPVLGLVVLVWLPLWLLAMVLRYSVSLATTLQVGLLLAVGAMLGYAIYLGDPTAWGRSLLERLLAPFLAEVEVLSGGEMVIENTLSYLAPFTLGLLFANGLASLLLSLLLGRWWQGLLFYPGGFQREFQELRLGRRAALAALLMLGLASVWQLPLSINVALLVIVVYALQGLAVVHGVVSKAGLAKSWLVAMYLLMLLALPQLLMLLAVLGVSDAWLDYRGRIRPPAGVP